MSEDLAEAGGAATAGLIACAVERAHASAPVLFKALPMHSPGSGDRGSR
jgi:hypothetical protein